MHDESRGFVDHEQRGVLINYIQRNRFGCGRSITRIEGGHDAQLLAAPHLVLGQG